jgi:hypothetical protein
MILLDSIAESIDPDLHSKELYIDKFKQKYNRSLICYGFSVVELIMLTISFEPNKLKGIFIFALTLANMYCAIGMYVKSFYQSKTDG